jgi:16S rRNA (adenine1518-N6/adenine1519-N6)-dimethyltransferase
MNLSELLLFLEKLGKKPQKGLSQNFLIDKNIIKKIISLAEINPGDPVLEIGPGPGALTQALLDAGAHVFAVEKDRVFIHELERLQTNDSRLKCISADFLKLDLKNHFPAPLKVVANLPYSITTPILEKLLSSHTLFSSFTLMVQKEVAQRMIANSCSKEFGSLSLFIQFYLLHHGSFPVAPTCFYPRPSIDSTVIRFDVRSQLPLNDPTPFFALTQKAFQQRRKMLTTSLKSLYSHETVQKALHQIGSRIDARPESLSLNRWLEFHKTLQLK